MQTVNNIRLVELAKIFLTTITNITNNALAGHRVDDSYWTLEDISDMVNVCELLIDKDASATVIDEIIEKYGSVVIDLMPNEMVELIYET